MRRSFLALAFLPLLTACPDSRPPSPPPPGFPARLEALGTEPFWSLDIDGDAAVYSAVAGPEKLTLQLARRESNGALELTAASTAGAFSARIIREDCSDGMSDRIYPYAVELRLGAENLQGCARPPGYHKDKP